MCFCTMKEETRLEAGGRLTLEYSGRLKIEDVFLRSPATMSLSSAFHSRLHLPDKKLNNQRVWKMNEWRP